MRGFSLSFTCTLLIGAATLLAPTGWAAEPPEIQIYKLASCGCCRPWIKYMEAAGFVVQVTDLDDVHPLKREKGIPEKLFACHTATIGDYLLEGHVSAEDVRRLLQERPPIVGLIVPGMPPGAPGMEGPDPVAYDVLALEKDGTTSVFATHEPNVESPSDSPPAATGSP